MLFNFEKCKCLTRYGKTWVNYEMGGTILCKTLKEKDLGVTINGIMKVSTQCIFAASQGNQIHRMIGRNITYKWIHCIKKLRKLYTDSIQGWRPYHRKDIDILEQIQMRATKPFQCLQILPIEKY